jgi:3-oxoacyl-[acyl-carrier protein] reductase
MNLDLKNKVALVCGASQGIGRASAMELAKLGCTVIVLARTQDKLKKLLTELPPGNHQLLVGDLDQWEVVKENLKKITEKNPISILINNAGGPAGGPISEAKKEDFQATFNRHVLASSALAQELIPGMKKLGFGRIINIISTSVKTPLPGLGVSNTVRAAMASWAKTLSLEVAEFGITVNSVLPGATQTERLEKLLIDWSKKSGLTIEQETKNRESLIPAKRFGKPEEIAAFVAFLASPAAAYINGTATAVDGGRTACF